MKLKISNLDKAFSEYVRLCSGGYCKRCKKYCGAKGLQSAHMFGRIRHTTRWNEKNVYALCASCHYGLDTNPIKKTSFLYEVLSEKEIRELEELSRKTIKDEPIDKEKLLEEYKQKIKLLKGE